jgi:hypothetical protein
MKAADRSIDIRSPTAATATAGPFSASSSSSSASASSSSSSSASAAASAGGDEFDSFVEQEIETVETETVLHKVCYPPHYDVEGEKAARAAAAAAPALRPPAKKYPFVLDPFQVRRLGTRM